MGVGAERWACVIHVSCAVTPCVDCGGCAVLCSCVVCLFVVSPVGSRRVLHRVSPRLEFSGSHFISFPCVGSSRSLALQRFFLIQCISMLHSYNISSLSGFDGFDRFAP